MRGIKDVFWYMLASISIIYFLVLQCTGAAMNFNFIFLVIGILSFIYGLYVKKFKKNKSFKIINKWIKTFISIIVVVIIIAGGIMSIYAAKKDMNKADYLVVLGAGLLNGDQISLSLKYRLDAVLEYLEKSDNGEIIVVSGGKGNDEKISEASAMKDYLIKEGIERNRILMEDKSTNTFENFKYSKEVIENYGHKNIGDIKIKIFTNGFHSFRSEMLSKRVGYGRTSIYSAKTPWYLVPSSYGREALAIVKSFIFDK